MKKNCIFIILLLFILLFTSCSQIKKPVVRGDYVPKVGKIVMSDGTFLKAKDYERYAGSEIPVGIICNVDPKTGTGVMFGFDNNYSSVGRGGPWAPGDVLNMDSSSFGYRYHFKSLEGTIDGGDIDGSDNWAVICKEDPEGTKDAESNYPGFYSALHYAELANLQNTPYKFGWYIPTLYEAYNYVAKNYKTLNKSLKKIGREIPFSFWTSSQPPIDPIWGNSDRDDCMAYSVSVFEDRIDYHDYYKDMSDSYLFFRSFDICSVGDIVLSDGSFIDESLLSFYDNLAKPVGVVCNVDVEKGYGLMVGTENSGDVDFPWAVKETSRAVISDYLTGLVKKEIPDVPLLQGKDGSVNWSEICTIDPEGTDNPILNYPAFNYMLSYPETADLVDTEYENGWYIPSAFETQEYICNQIEILNKSLLAVKGMCLDNTYYWTSSFTPYTDPVSSYVNLIRLWNTESGFSFLQKYTLPDDECASVFCVRHFDLYQHKAMGIGDIYMSDGSFLKSKDFSKYSGVGKPVGIVCKINPDGNSGLMLGIHNSGETHYSWAPEESTGYTLQLPELIGDEDGSDNWEVICSAEPIGTKDPAKNYPAFNYVLEYSHTANLDGTGYEKGWYMPTAFEFYWYLYLNRESINRSLSVIDGADLLKTEDWISSLFWCSSLSTYKDSNGDERKNRADYGDFRSCIYSSINKETEIAVCCLRAFSTVDSVGIQSE